MEIKLTATEARLLSELASSKDYKITAIEKNDAEFRVHYTLYGGTGSRAIVYNLGLSMVQGIRAIRKLEKEIA